MCFRVKRSLVSALNPQLITSPFPLPHPLPQVKGQNEMMEYVEDLQCRLVGWDGPSLLSLGPLIDVGDFKVADESNKRTQRHVLLFTEALVICKPRASGEMSIKQLFMMDKFFLNTMLHDPLVFSITFADKKVQPHATHTLAPRTLSH